MLNAFSGGIFLCLALLHMLPEVSHLFEVLGGEEKFAGFPLPYAIAVLSYAAFFLFDRVILKKCGGHSHEP